MYTFLYTYIIHIQVFGKVCTRGLFHLFFQRVGKGVGIQQSARRYFAGDKNQKNQKQGQTTFIAKIFGQN